MLRQQAVEVEKAIARRDAMKASVKDLELLTNIQKAERSGRSFLPATPTNCVVTLGDKRPPQCPLAFESQDLLRHLAKCGILNYDIPRHLLEPVVAAAPWENLVEDVETREALSQLDGETSREIEAAAKLAYLDVFGEELPPSMAVGDALTDLIRSEQGQSSSPAFSQAALARLGEVSEEEIADMPPLDQFFARISLAGDRYEAALASVVGEKAARELRAQNQGWESQGVAGGNMPNHSPDCEVGLPEESE